MLYLSLEKQGNLKNILILETFIRQNNIVISLGNDGWSVWTRASKSVVSQGLRGAAIGQWCAGYGQQLVT